MFLLEHAVELLVGERNELFKHERAIRLFQFHVWSLTSSEFPAGTAYVGRAGQMAAIKFIDYLEEEDFCESEESAARRFSAAGERVVIDLADKPQQRMARILTMRHTNNIYRQIYDHMLAIPGGLLALLGTPSLSKFDCDMVKRQADAKAVVGVVDYRLRYIQHRPGEKRGAGLKHAFHFMWAATRDIPGKRGKTVEGKSPSARTLGAKWRQYERSAIFIYLNERHGFSQYPIPIDDYEFVPNLLKQSEEIAEMRRYFGAYAYIAESFEAAGGAQPFVKVPDTVTRVPVSTARFSDGELRIMAAYNEDKPFIDSRLEPDDLDLDI